MTTPLTARAGRCRAVFFLVLGLFLLWGLLTLKSYPPVNYNIGDEIWVMDNSELLWEGRLKQDYLTPRLYFLAVAASMAALGKGIFAARALSLAAALAVLALVYVTASLMAGEEAGLIAALLLASSYAFIWHSKVARHEILSAAFIVSAFTFLYYSFMTGRTGRTGAPRYLFYGGLVAVLAIHVHPNNAQYLGGIVLVYAALFGKRVFGRDTLYFAAGLALGVALWFYTASAYSAASGLNAGGLQPVQHLRRDPLGLLQEAIFRFPKDYVLGYLGRFGDFYPSAVGIKYYASMAFAILAAAMFTPRRKEVLLPILMVAASGMTLYFLTFKLGFHHTVEFYPFVSIALGVGLIGLRERADNIRPALARALPLAAAALFVVPGTMDSALTYSKFRAYSYDRLLMKVSEAVPEGSRVMGTDLYAPAFERGDYVKAWFNVEGTSQCGEFGGVLEATGVDYVLLDSVLRNFAATACGPAYPEGMLRHLFLDSEMVAVIDERYPNIWADGGMISEIAVFGPPSQGH